MLRPNVANQAITLLDLRIEWGILVVRRARLMSTVTDSGNIYICPMCGKPIDREMDRTADENGHLMHEACYMKPVGKDHSASES